MPPLAVRVRLLAGLASALAKVTLLFLRPLSPIAAAAVLLRCWWVSVKTKRRRPLKHEYVALIVTLWQALVYARDDLAKRARPFRVPRRAFGKKLATRLSPSLEEPRRPPWLARGGDVASIFDASFRMPWQPAIKFERVSVPVPWEGDPLAVDMCDPPVVSPTSTATLVLVPGVAGDATAPYVQAMAKTALDRGLRVAVLHPRGMRGVKASSLTQLLDPSDTRDLGCLIEHLATPLAQSKEASSTKSPSPASPSSIDSFASALSSLGTASIGANSDGADVSPSPMLVLCGFSMGAMIVTKHVAEAGDSLHPAVVGAVCFSGTARTYFMDDPRYRNYYQPIISNALAGDAVDHYSHELRQLLGNAGVMRLAGVQSYADIYNRLFALLPGRGGGYEAWRKRMETGGELLCTAKRPLLVVTSADDPLHHVGKIGVDEFEAAATLNPLVGLWITERGGHVGWPEAGAAPFAFMSRVTSTFVDTVVGWRAEEVAAAAGNGSSIAKGEGQVGCASKVDTTSSISVEESGGDDCDDEEGEREDDDSSGAGSDSEDEEDLPPLLIMHDNTEGDADDDGAEFDMMALEPGRRARLVGMLLRIALLSHLFGDGSDDGSGGGSSSDDGENDDNEHDEMQ